MPTTGQHYFRHEESSCDKIDTVATGKTIKNIKELSIMYIKVSRNIDLCIASKVNKLD